MFNVNGVEFTDIKEKSKKLQQQQMHTKFVDKSKQFETPNPRIFIVFSLNWGHNFLGEKSNTLKQ